ncbi:MAG TPA: carboxymuconolactone decarboxylase family protein [Acidimicrobiales bacterium]|jgi:AhpD family alkylhydroperoxidase|nr:carboxymuconolactone decarboxylase family protein [Acidimicrobiales bacterium]
MKSRITNPAIAVPGAMEAFQTLGKVAKEAAKNAGVPESTIELMSFRASQINGCAVCLDMHARGLKKMGESDERLLTLAAWRETPYFTDAERAALALAEAGTRLADRSNPVPDEVFNGAAKYYDEAALAALVMSIAAINAWNRLNVISAQETGEWVAQWVG